MTRRATIVMNVTEATLQGEQRHYGVVMRMLGHQLGFLVTSQNSDGLWNVPQKVEFDVELDGATIPKLPTYCSARFRR